jgi:hypothetical protein
MPVVCSTLDSAISPLVPAHLLPQTGGSDSNPHVYQLKDLKEGTPLV